ncbi:MAG: hypothetical protein PHV43_01710 [Candidatus Colwellbacteria bacterium]|nr:hypothetical protein [Candidatus Colwellbacteria bacterium]
MKSAQSIEDFYVGRGYRGERLRKALEADREYQEVLKRKRSTLTKRVNATSAEQQRYVLSIDPDFTILDRCKKLEKQKLSLSDQQLVHLIKSQLKQDWRKPLNSMLRKLETKYRIER